MIFIFYSFAALLLYFSLRSFIGGVRYLDFVKSELSRSDSNFTPFVTVIAPCKGIEDGLAENLSVVLEQHYPDYEVIFVVDDANDPAAEAAKTISKNSSIQTKLVVAPKAAESSQKVENLREAVLHAEPQSEVFVFVDSDTRPSHDWLRSLVAPLEKGSIGAATGYRWFLAKRASAAAEIRSAWNASIATALGPNLDSNFCWGGSVAIRRKDFEDLDLRDRWKGTVSDDFVMTEAVKEAGLNIFFVPQALTASIGSCSFREMLEFTTRQMKLTRVYVPKLWLLSYFGSGLFNITLIWALIIVATMPFSTFPPWIAAATLALVTVLSFGKSHVRWLAVYLMLNEHKNAVRKQYLPQVTLWLPTPALFLFNCVAATFSRKIVWRGITYEMVSASQTVVSSSVRPADRRSAQT
jgi:cellulose synthase/poly-beta-1,6-N-acetylglucosamine synthase-like glycosyltransferase